jgi:PadR family transcriptional regulator, regulatory protein PadR
MNQEMTGARMTELMVQTKKFQKELNSGTSSLVLLSVLSRSKEALYGYQIAKMLEASGDIPMMKQGTLYPVLRSLEESGLLESIVEPSVSGPPRRYYKITKDGRTTLDEWLDIWKQTKKFVDAILKG